MNKEVENEETVKCLCDSDIFYAKKGVSTALSPVMV